MMSPTKRSGNVILPFNTPGSMTHSKKFDMSIGKRSVVESDADALINWAKGLPDDV
jgi:hypothetical protein